jgi:lysophospholipase L1-like esterase
MKSTSTTGPAPSARSKTSSRGVARLLLFAAGVVLCAGAAIHNPWTVELAVRAARALFHKPGIGIPENHLIHRAQIVYLAAGALVLAAAWLIGRWPAVDRWFRRPLVEKMVLAVVVVALPLAWLEIGLRPFVPPHEKTTTIFVRDDELGWKLRPGAVDQWGGVEVRINERGFRGPVVPYERAPGKRRILFLGDSVTFGYTIARWEDTWPHVLADLVAARDSLPVETVNLAVEGYSQWQQYIVLSNEGAKYDPDLVVIGFVLNDVTEMFHLARFGGSDEGFQLRHSYASRAERLLSKSALLYELQNVIREVKARRRLGDDLRLGAIRQEQLEVETLMHSPDQPNVRTAWDIALGDLQRIVDWCAARDIPVLVVVFPFTVQLDDPAGLSAPQKVIVSYAHARVIPTIDLLPRLADYTRAAGALPSDLFADHDHLSLEGHRVVADLLADPVAGILANP